MWVLNRRQHLKTLRGFLRREDGNFTVEFVMWLPLIVFVMTATADLSMAGWNMNRVWDTAQSTARRLSTGQITAEQAQGFVAQSLPARLAPVVSVDETSEVDVAVTIALPAANLTTLGTTSLFTEGTIDVSFVMRKEF